MRAGRLDLIDPHAASLLTDIPIRSAPFIALPSIVLQVPSQAAWRTLLPLGVAFVSTMIALASAFLSWRTQVFGFARDSELRHLLEAERAAEPARWLGDPSNDPFFTEVQRRLPRRLRSLLPG